MRGDCWYWWNRWSSMFKLSNFGEISNKLKNKNDHCRWVSDCCLMLNEQFELYHGENKLHVISAGFTIVLKHRATLTRGPHLPAKHLFYDGFMLIWCNFKFEGFLFRSDSRHNDRVDSLLECATKQTVMTVAQWHINQIIIRGLWLLAKKGWRWIHAYVVQF